MTPEGETGYPGGVKMTCNQTSLLRQGVNFCLHLRWHYQVGILSGGYLLGGLISGIHQAGDFLFHFLVIHLLLFGGATVYNSFWDKDDGPVGGLQNPPELAGWTRPASMVLQYLGLILSIPMGITYIAFYLMSMLLFWMYSHPSMRWKGHPWLSMVAIGISTGINSVIFGFLAAGSPFTFHMLIPALGVALIMLSVYPISQIYQIREDRRRGDRTFVAAYGPKSVHSFFLTAFFPGVAFTTAGFYHFVPGLTLVFAFIAFTAGILLSIYIRSLKGDESEYSRVMKMKYFTSSIFVLFLAGAIFFG